MKYEYEQACRKEGISEEKIQQIRKLFDGDKKRLKRENMYRKKYLRSYFISSDGNEVETNVEELSKLDIIDENKNVEYETETRVLIEQLRNYLSELDDKDREILWAFYQGLHGEVERVRRKYSMTRKQITCRMEYLVRILRNRFF